MAGFVVLDITQEDYNLLIRDKAIDEFVEKLLENAPKNWAGELDLNGMTCYLSANKVMEIAEQMKENEFFNFSSPVVRIDEKSYNKAINDFVVKMELWNNQIKSIRNESAFFTIENIYKIAHELKEMRNE